MFLLPFYTESVKFVMPVHLYTNYTCNYNVNIDNVSTATNGFFQYLFSPVNTHVHQL